MTSQMDVSSGRQRKLATAAHAAAPTLNTTPDFTLSPQSATGLKTTGFAIALYAPTATPATPNAGGFSVIVWTQNPVTRRYAAWEATTIDFLQQFVTFDFDACRFYIQIDPASVAANGDILVEVMEQ